MRLRSVATFSDIYVEQYAAIYLAVYVAVSYLYCTLDLQRHACAKKACYTRNYIDVSLSFDVLCFLSTLLSATNKQRLRKIREKVVAKVRAQILKHKQSALPLQFEDMITSSSSSSSSSSSGCFTDGVSTATATAAPYAGLTAREVALQCTLTVSSSNLNTLRSVCCA
jgi:hypothetical protein